VLDGCDLRWELLIVDDGSADDTQRVVGALLEREPRLRVHRLPCRRGQTQALAAGFALARAPLVATLDADLQCHPRDLPMLVGALGDADMAAGIRRRRQDSVSRSVASAVANGVRRLVLARDLRDLACPLRVMRADALATLVARGMLFDGAHRWLPALFQLAGFRVVQRNVEHHPRLAGRSKYTTLGRLLPIAREIVKVAALKSAGTPARPRAERSSTGAARLPDTRG
jgi:dolichol-phosphate mannosyltransferase